jgi:methyl-accepting chemotaxis protein
MLAVSAARQTATMKTLAQGTAEQSTTTEQISHAMRDVRSRVREISAALVGQAKTAQSTAKETATVAREIAAVRAASAEQAELVTRLSGGPGNGAAEPVT